MSASILVVDDDKWLLRMVTSVLEKRGYAITTASDGDEAYAQAILKTPDLIVTDVMMPKTDGWMLIKRLRARPESAFVPVIFLTGLGSEADRIRGFRLGADDYLPKPFRFEELELRVANALKRRPARPEAPTAIPSAGLRGTLDQLGLSSLLTLFDMEKKSGVLVLECGEDKGRLFFKDGQVVRVRIDGKNDPTNAEAVYDLLCWSEGTFEFSSREVDMENEVNAATGQLLTEGAKRMDERYRGDSGF